MLSIHKIYWIFKFIGDFISLVIYLSVNDDEDEDFMRTIFYSSFNLFWIILIYLQYKWRYRHQILPNTKKSDIK